MRKLAAGRPVRTTFRTVRRVLRRCLLGVLTGCRGPAAPYVCEPGAQAPPRCVLLARQVLADSAVELARRPLGCGRECLCETADHLAAAGHSLIAKRLVLPLQGPPGPVRADAAPLDLGALEAALHRLTGNALQPACVRLCTDGREALAVLERLIDQATCRIDVIMFYWESDGLGERLAARLAARAAAGVRVRVLIDGGGNLFFGHPRQDEHAAVNRVIAA